MRRLPPRSTRTDTLCPDPTLVRSVARLHAGTMGRGIVDWRDNLDEAILHGDLDTKAAELALGLHPHVAEGFGIEVAGVRVERREHALDGKLDQVLVADLFHVVG